MNNNPAKKKKIKTTLIALGCCCLLAAVALDGYNRWDAFRAAEASAHMADDILAMLHAGGLPDTAVAGTGQDKELVQIDEQGLGATMAVGGYDISGVLSIDAVHIRLAIIDKWSYANLKISACRYSGTPDEQMILLAHNYKGHFGKLDKLVPGDKVTYTDASGVAYNYEVTGTEIWATGQLREIMAGDEWDLTLFTCTYSGDDRVVVRCSRV